MNFCNSVKPSRFITWRHTFGIFILSNGHSCMNFVNARDLPNFSNSCSTASIAYLILVLWLATLEIIVKHFIKSSQDSPKPINNKTTFCKYGKYLSNMVSTSRTVHFMPFCKVNVKSTVSKSSWFIVDILNLQFLNFHDSLLTFQIHSF